LFDLRVFGAGLSGNPDEANQLHNKAETKCCANQDDEIRCEKGDDEFKRIGQSIGRDQQQHTERYEKKADQYQRDKFDV
jgi:hypothetical protein